MSGILIDVDVRERKARENLEKINKSIKNIDKTTSKATRSVARLVKGLGTALAAGFSVNAFKNITSDLTALENNIVTVTGRTNQLNKSFNNLTDIAIRTRRDLGGTVKLFTGLGRSLQDYNVPLETLTDTTEVISKAIAIQNFGVESANSAIIQFSQGLAAGELRGQELLSVMEQTPRLAKAISDGLGKSIGDLKKLGEAGELETPKLLEAILSQTDQIQKEFELLTPTINESFSNFSTAIKKTLFEFDKTSKISTTISEVISGFSKSILESSDSIAEFGLDMRYAFNTSIANVQILGSAFGQLIDAIIIKAQDEFPRLTKIISNVFDGISQIKIVDLFSQENILGLYNTIVGIADAIKESTTLLYKFKKAIRYQDFVSVVDLSKFSIDFDFITDIKHKFDSLINDITDVISNSWYDTIFLLSHPFRTIEDDIIDSVDRILEIFNRIRENRFLNIVLRGFSEFGKKLVDIFKYIYEEIIGNSWWTDTIDAIIDTSSNLWRSVSDGISRFVSGIVNAFQIIHSIASLRLFFYDITYEIQKGFRNISEVVQSDPWWIDLIESFENAFLALQHIARKVLSYISDFTTLSLHSLIIEFSISKEFNLIERELSGVFNSLEREFSKNTWWDDFIDNIIETSKTLWYKVKSGFELFADNIRYIFNSVYNEVTGDNFLYNIASAVHDIKNTIKDKISLDFDTSSLDILDAFNDSPLSIDVIPDFVYDSAIITNLESRIKTIVNTLGENLNHVIVAAGALLGIILSSVLPGSGFKAALIAILSGTFIKSIAVLTEELGVAFTDSSIFGNLAKNIGEAVYDGLAFSIKAIPDLLNIVFATISNLFTGFISDIPIISTLIAPIQGLVNFLGVAGPLGLIGGIFLGKKALDVLSFFGIASKSIQSLYSFIGGIVTKFSGAPEGIIGQALFGRQGQRGLNFLAGGGLLLSLTGAFDALFQDSPITKLIVEGGLLYLTFFGRAGLNTIKTKLAEFGTFIATRLFTFFNLGQATSGIADALFSRSAADAIRRRIDSIKFDLLVGNASSAFSKIKDLYSTFMNFLGQRIAKRMSDGFDSLVLSNRDSFRKIQMAYRRMIIGMRRLGDRIAGPSGLLGRVLRGKLGLGLLLGIATLFFSQFADAAQEGADGAVEEIRSTFSDFTREFLLFGITSGLFFVKGIRTAFISVFRGLIGFIGRTLLVGLIGLLLSPKALIIAAFVGIGAVITSTFSDIFDWIADGALNLVEVFTPLKREIQGLKDILEEDVLAFAELEGLKLEFGIDKEFVEGLTAEQNKDLRDLLDQYAKKIREINQQRIDTGEVTEASLDAAKAIADKLERRVDIVYDVQSRVGFDDLFAREDFLADLPWTSDLELLYERTKIDIIAILEKGENFVRGTFDNRTSAEITQGYKLIDQQAQRLKQNLIRELTEVDKNLLFQQKEFEKIGSGNIRREISEGIKETTKEVAILTKAYERVKFDPFSSDFQIADAKAILEAYKKDLFDLRQLAILEFRLTVDAKEFTNFKTKLRDSFEDVDIKLDTDKLFAAPGSENRLEALRQQAISLKVDKARVGTLQEMVEYLDRQRRLQEELNALALEANKASSIRKQFLLQEVATSAKLKGFSTDTFENLSTETAEKYYDRLVDLTNRLVKVRDKTSKESIEQIYKDRDQLTKDLFQEGGINAVVDMADFLGVDFKSLAENSSFREIEVHLGNLLNLTILLNEAARTGSKEGYIAFLRGIADYRKVIEDAKEGFDSLFSSLGSQINYTDLIDFDKASIDALINLNSLRKKIDRDREKLLRNPTDDQIRLIGIQERQFNESLKRLELSVFANTGAKVLEIVKEVGIESLKNIPTNLIKAIVSAKRKIKALEIRLEQPLTLDKLKEVTNEIEKQNDIIKDIVKSTKTLEEKFNDINSILGYESSFETFLGLPRNLQRGLINTTKAFEKAIENASNDPLRLKRIYDNLRILKTDIRTLNLFESVKDQLEELTIGGIQAGFDIFKNKVDLGIDAYINLTNREEITEELLQLQAIEDLLLKTNLDPNQLARIENLLQSGLPINAVFSKLEVEFKDNLEKVLTTPQQILNTAANTFSTAVGSFARAVSNLPAIQPVQRALGGMIYGPGGPKDDKIPAMLSNGEFVVNAASTTKNRALLEAINKDELPKFAEGGALGVALQSVDYLKKDISPFNKEFIATDLQDLIDSYKPLLDNLNLNELGALNTKELDKVRSNLKNYVVDLSDKLNYQISYIQDLSNGSMNTSTRILEFADLMNVPVTRIGEVFATALHEIGHAIDFTVKPRGRGEIVERLAGITGDSTIRRESQASIIAEKGLNPTKTNLINEVPMKGDLTSALKTYVNVYDTVFDKSAISYNLKEWKEFLEDYPIDTYFLQIKGRGFIDDIANNLDPRTVIPAVYGGLQDWKRNLVKFVDSIGFSISNEPDYSSANKLLNLLIDDYDYKPYGPYFKTLGIETDDPIKHVDELFSLNKEQLEAVLNLPNDNHYDFLKEYSKKVAGVDLSFIDKIKRINIKSLKHNLVALGADIGFQQLIDDFFVTGKHAKEIADAKEGEWPLEARAAFYAFGTVVDEINKETAGAIVGGAVGRIYSNIPRFSRYLDDLEEYGKEIFEHLNIIGSTKIDLPTIKEVLAKFKPQRKLANGGMIYGPGGPKDDKIPAMLSNREFVVNAKSTNKYRSLLEAINADRVAGFANGSVEQIQRIRANLSSRETSIRLDAQKQSLDGFITFVDLLNNLSLPSDIAEIGRLPDDVYQNVREHTSKYIDVMHNLNVARLKGNRAEIRVIQEQADNLKEHIEELVQAEEDFRKARKKAGTDLVNTLRESTRGSLSKLIKEDADFKEISEYFLDKVTSDIVDTVIDGFVTSLFKKSKVTDYIEQIGTEIFDIGTGYLENIFGLADFKSEKVKVKDLIDDSDPYQLMPEVTGLDGMTKPLANLCNCFKTNITDAASGLLDFGIGTGPISSPFETEAMSFDDLVSATIPSVNMDEYQIGNQVATPFATDVLNFDDLLSTNQLTTETLLGIKSQDQSLFGSLGSTFTEGLNGLGDFLSGSLSNLMGGSTSGSGGGGFDAGSLITSALRFFFADGGLVKGPGTGTSDSIMAAISNGEFVVNADATKKNLRLLQAINSGRIQKFAQGGMVSSTLLQTPAMSTPDMGQMRAPEKGGETVINLTITGDISRQTKAEIYQMLPVIAQGVNGYNKEKGLIR